MDSISNNQTRIITNSKHPLANGSFPVQKTQQQDKVELGRKNTADIFLDETNKYNEKLFKPSFTTKYFTTTTTLPLLPVIFCESVWLTELITKRKKLPKPELKALRNKRFKQAVVANTIALGITTALATYFNSKQEKNLAETTQYFNSVNKTHAKLSDKRVSSQLIGATYDPLSGTVTLNQSFINDPWNKVKNKYLIKHELVHAKQFETIARMDDGIRKLNYTCLKNMASQLKEKMKNPLIGGVINDVYSELKNDTTGKYDNKTILITGNKLPYKEYIFTMFKLMNNKEKDYTDVPMFINVEHYQKVRNDVGKLTPEEEKKANEYYEANLNYQLPGFIDAINPKSPYNQNILEKEAYKEIPWYIRYI